MTQEQLDKLTELAQFSDSRFGTQYENQNPANTKLRNALTPHTVISMLKEIRIWRETYAAAAGELALDIPEPGSDMAKLMIANKILKNRVQSLDGEVIVLTRVAIHSESTCECDTCAEFLAEIDFLVTT